MLWDKIGNFFFILKIKEERIWICCWNGIRSRIPIRIHQSEVRFLLLLNYLLALMAGLHFRGFFLRKIYSDYDTVAYVLRIEEVLAQKKTGWHCFLGFLLRGGHGGIYRFRGSRSAPKLISTYPNALKRSSYSRQVLGWTAHTSLWRLFGRPVGRRQRQSPAEPGNYHTFP